MKRSIFTTALTKSYIESKVSQELIISKYLNIPLEVINECITHNKLIPSVFREDGTKPSMGIQFNNKGRLKVRDFGGYGFFDDVYGVVAHVLSIIYERRIDTNNKQDFYFVLKHIANTFSNIIDGKETDPNFDDTVKIAINKSKQNKAIIEIVSRSWNKKDKQIWNKWGISLPYLNTHFVIPIDQYYINRSISSTPKYRYDEKDPCYAYTIGQNSKGIYLFKLYFPLRDRHKDLKFITNCNVIEGLLNLELDNYDYILITKSSKDRLSIGNHLFTNPLYGGDGMRLNIGIVNLPSEVYRLKEREYLYLKNKLANDGIIISLLDFDTTGRNGAKYLKDVYNIPYIFITRGEFGLKNYHCKDFADLHDKYSIKEINDFIKSTLIYADTKFKRKNLYLYNADFLDIPTSNLPY